MGLQHTNSHFEEEPGGAMQEEIAVSGREVLLVGCMQRDGRIY